MEGLHRLPIGKKLAQPSVELLGHSDLQNQIMQYAYRISNDKTFLYILKAECGDVSADCRGETNDWGLCQLHYPIHKTFIRSSDFQDWRKQVDYCYRVYQDAITKGRLSTTFYAVKNIGNVKHYFKFYD